jgi:chaperonin GroES
MKIRPLHDRIIVRRIPPATMTAGGLHIPESAQPKQQRGEVVFCGPGQLLKNGSRAPMPCAVGETVIFGLRAGEDFQFDGETLSILTAEYCVGVEETAGAANG